MSFVLSSQLKLNRIKQQIEQLLNADAPFESCEMALLQLRHVVERFEAKLADASDLQQVDVIKATAENINQLILDVLPTLGFIIRSTNVRNAFELYEPLNEIANAVLENKSKLILSSEWDYIPFAYPIGTNHLPHFTFIGFPAYDAENILIMPLAGHELGHAIWRRSQISGGVDITLDNHLQDLYSKNIDEYSRHNPRFKPEGDLLNQEELDNSIAHSTEVASRHAEEYFCDLVGLLLFGSSFLRAFALILAPGMGRTTRFDYPSTLDRARLLQTYAAQVGVFVPSGFVDAFNREPGLRPLEHRFSQQAVQKILPGLWEQAKTAIAKAPKPSEAGAAAVLDRFSRGSPYSKPASLADIANAAWRRYDQIVAEDIVFGRASEKIEQLNEMALKTVEALEYQNRVSPK